MAQARKILIVFCFGILSACSTRYDDVAPDTELVVTVKDESGAILDSAGVFVFADKSAFDNTALTGVPTGFVGASPVTQGMATIKGLPYGKQLYIYAASVDRVAIPGHTITIDNADASNTLKNNLTRGSITYTEVTVTPADGFITFWTTPSNSFAVPIAVFVGNSSVGIVLQTSPSVPIPFQTDGLTVRARRGNVSFEGKSAAGCIWTGQVTLAGGEIASHQFVDCVVGSIAFYTDNSNAAAMPISIIINANDQVPNLVSPVTGTPADCGDLNLSVANRVPGNYTYEAISANGSCAWTDTFTLAANECKLIYLTTCQ
jgi:hypothetical protein